ncbi:hypothetical protein M513_14380 [Trichuris suis]|uniref:Uncharacterized protein n=1 Tax=Trichuris suis TaxID=68888 RepID=A0A085LIE7_9BILA|nr:hypothetical protein M513_14380 [Trichuris suis]
MLGRSPDITRQRQEPAFFSDMRKLQCDHGAHRKPDSSMKEDLV